MELQLAEITPRAARALRCTRAAILEVLETMFFELPADEGQCAAPRSGVRSAVVQFAGTMPGLLRVAIEPHMLSRLTQNFLGLDELEPPSIAEERQVLCELANMLCGAALSRFEPDGRLSIGSPEETALNPQEEAIAAASLPWIRSPLECGDIWVHLEIAELP